MNIYYQWVPGSYSSMAAAQVQNIYTWIRSCIWVKHFDDVRKEVEQGNGIAVLPIENSYAGTIHRNVYNFLQYNHIILSDIILPINHCLMWISETYPEIDINYKAHSHPQALAQTYDYCKKNNIWQHDNADTAWAALYISKLQDPSQIAIASEQAAVLYGLHIYDRAIQDQEGNQTRFLITAHPEYIPKTKKIEHCKSSIQKITLMFAVRNIPGVLYKCLWAFATHGIDLTKIESLPSQEDPFTYIFWIECLWDQKSEKRESCMQELWFYTTHVRNLSK